MSQGKTSFDQPRVGTFHEQSERPSVKKVSLLVPLLPQHGPPHEPLPLKAQDSRSEFWVLPPQDLERRLKSKSCLFCHNTA
jgi:hypothetical protein